MGLFLERGRHWLALPGLRRSRRGFTFIEVALVIAILAVVATLALPRYSDYRDRVRIAQAVTDIREIEANLQHYYADNRGYPNDLSVIGMAGKLDPWGNPYQYTDLADIKGKGKARKDKSLVPINSDFDLWSMGKDGQTVMPLTAKASRDDIIRAGDGRFVGLASDFDP
jgi:general secretion pathway protein G